jgi:hypothetical protein
MRYLPTILIALCLAGCAAFSPEVQRQLEDPTLLAEIREEIAKLPEGHPERVKLEKQLAKVGDAQTVDDLVEAAALAVPSVGAGLLIAWRLLKRRLARSETALRQVVTGVEGAPKSPELKASLLASTDEDSKAVIERYRAALPQTPEVELPALVSK